MDLERWLSEAARVVQDWQDGFGSYTAHDSLQVSDERFAPAFAELARPSKVQGAPTYGEVTGGLFDAIAAGHIAADIAPQGEH